MSCHRTVHSRKCHSHDYLHDCQYRGDGWDAYRSCNGYRIHPDWGTTAPLNRRCKTEGCNNLTLGAKDRQLKCSECIAAKSKALMERAVAKVRNELP